MSDERNRWWPSPFGHDDQLGMLNQITDATRATTHHKNGGGLGAKRVNRITEQIAGTQQPVRTSTP